MSWLYARVLHHIDRLVYHLTRGRYTFGLGFGLLVVMLTTTGAKTGQQRTFPVLGVPDDDNLVVITSNWESPGECRRNERISVDRLEYDPPATRAGMSE